jgi:hypothetical protein
LYGQVVALVEEMAIPPSPVVEDNSVLDLVVGTEDKVEQEEQTVQLEVEVREDIPVTVETAVEMVQSV